MTALAQDRKVFETLHHNHPLAERKAILEMYAADAFPVLLSTDLAARDVYVKGIHEVVIVGTPDDASDYVWLCSRAGAPPLTSPPCIKSLGIQDEFHKHASLL